MMLNRRDDKIEYQYFEEIALDNGVPHQVDPKPSLKKGNPFRYGDIRSQAMINPTHENRIIVVINTTFD